MIRIDLMRERFYRAKESIDKRKKCPYSLELDGRDCCLVGSPDELDNYTEEKCPYLMQEMHKVGGNPEYVQVRIDEDRPDDVQREDYLGKELHTCSIPKEDVPDSALEVSPVLKTGYFVPKEPEQPQKPKPPDSKKKFIM